MLFILFVIADRVGTATATANEMQAIDGFNEKLQEKGQLIFAGGLSAPKNGSVIDNRNSAGLESGKPLFEAQENFSGFWLINASNLEEARDLAFEGSKACNRKVELRPLLS